MLYQNIVSGHFLARPNRFLARVRLEDGEANVHVKNTGRCREILQPETRVYLEKSDDPRRKTGWSLVAATKGRRLINIDSQAPNKVVAEALTSGALTLTPRGWQLAAADAARPEQAPGAPATRVRPESTYGASRFDFYYETATARGYIEVKGVTLETDEVMRFPDAPTQRGARHMEELLAATREGFSCWVFFVVQMTGGQYFTPNDATDPAFGRALRQAAAGGVGVQAFTCQVTPATLTLDQHLPCRLAPD